MTSELNLLTVGPVGVVVLREEEEGKPPAFFLMLTWNRGEPTWFRLTERGPVLVKGELQQQVAPWTPRVVVGGKE